MDSFQFDKEHLWHPYASFETSINNYKVLSAKGVELELSNGQKIIDGMSSWWSVIHGYNHPEINKAAKDQIDKMSHVMFGGLTHEPAITLGKQLLEILPNGLEKIFYCDSGSVSVEVAMKMAIQYQYARGHYKKSKLMTFRGGYHGDTTGAMSVCDPENGMHHLFANFLPKHFFSNSPELGFDRELTNEQVQELEHFFITHSKESAAFILEPIVQGAGGMRIYSPQYLKIIRSLCDQYDVLLIADEIATGFGRTGELFAVNHANVIPDIICIGKALTGGYLSMAATICTLEIATVISKDGGVLMHGPTFMANPLSCAVASKSIELLLRSEWRNNIKTIESILSEKLFPLKKLDAVKDVRVIGTIGVVEMNASVDVAKVQRFLVEQGVWLRPFRNLIYTMPPYTIKKEEMRKVCSVITSLFNENVFT